MDPSKYYAISRDNISDWWAHVLLLWSWPRHTYNHSYVWAHAFIMISANTMLSHFGWCNIVGCFWTIGRDPLARCYWAFVHIDLSMLSVDFDWIMSGKLILYFVPLGGWCHFVMVGRGEEGVCIYYVQHSSIPVVVILHVWTIFPTFYMFCTVLYSPGCILS